MNVTLIAVGLPVAALVCGSIVLFARRNTIWRLLQLLGASCLAVMVFAHVAEAFGLFPMMGWGQLHSAGHYLDLAAAALGLILFPLGYVIDALSARENSNWGGP